MNFLFVHGWAYDHTVWDPIIRALPAGKHHPIDFGYFGEPDIPPHIDEPVIAVGHSLGVLWLLTQTEIRFHALISICGFDNFSAHVRPATLKAMQLGLARRPERTLQDFWTACGARPAIDPSLARQEALANGLNGLENWDGRKAHAALNCPILALAASDDKIVSKEMSQTIWQNATLTWIETGGHALPLTNPNWCADEISKFAKHL